MVGMMWFKRDPKPVQEKGENGVVGKLRRKKAVVLKPTRESSERETSADSDKERRRYSDILDMKVSLERRDESDESLYESADCHSDAISASDDALPRLGKTPTLSKESLKLAITDEEIDLTKPKKGHRKTMSLSNPLDIVKNLGDEWFCELTKKENEKNCDKKKSRESLWSEEDRDSVHGSSLKLDQIRKNSKKEDKSLSNSRKSSATEAPKTRKTSKGSSVSALNFLRRKKVSSSAKPVESVSEDVVDHDTNTEEILNHTRLFLECEKRHASICDVKPPQETDTEDEVPANKVIGDHRRRLSRQTSRSKSKVRGKSQSVKVNTLRKSHSGTLKKAKKKSVKTPSSGRSRQASIVDQSPIVKKKHSDSIRHNSWLFSGSKGETKREGSADEQPAPEPDADAGDAAAKDTPDKDNNWRTTPSGGRGVNRAESCRERDAPRRGKHRNASDPNRLTAHNNLDLEPGQPTAPSGSSSSSSLSSRSNESNTVAAEQQASQSELSEEEEPLAAQWADSLAPHELLALQLSPRVRKRQEVIHELIVSEGSHVRWLKVLCRVFLRPLEAAPALLPPEELKALFPNLPDVRDWHVALHTRLRTIRNNSPGYVVPLGELADTMLSTVGEAPYLSAVSRFCRGQRLALDALRERRRKHKELHQFLAAREQLPLCGRLQLRDLLATVWQRLTKYHLLLESVLKTVSEEEDPEEEVARMKRALEEAKYMLHTVNTAIRTTENEHRLKSIQAKLEVRAGSEWDELRRLDLTAKTLRLEGELSLRIDPHKKIVVQALMFEDMLVLLQREGDKFLLKPIPQQHGQLSPIIRWDKVLFRRNAAARNTFFLMNINGVQMHELSTNTATDYSTWVDSIQQSPLAKVEKQSVTPSHQASRSTDDSGINVSRNPSDASEKSNVTSTDELESDKDRQSAERTQPESERDSNTERASAERETEDTPKDDKKQELDDKEDKQTGRRPTVGRISTHACPPGLEPALTLTVSEPVAHTIAHTATTAYTHQEVLRRLQRGIRSALRAQAGVVGAVLAVPPHLHRHLADMAVEDAKGAIDVRSELRATRRQSRDCSDDDDDDDDDDDASAAPDMRQLLLAAHAQASELTEAISRALWVSEAAAVSARRRRGLCRACQRGPAAEAAEVPAPPVAEAAVPAELSEADLDHMVQGSMSRLTAALEAQGSADGLPDMHEGDADQALEGSESSLSLARRLWSLASGLQGSLSAAVGALPSAEGQSAALRAQLALLREDNHRLRAALHTGYQTTDEIYLLKPDAEQPLQDQPSNGG